jgi:Flp pilus assembly protein TadD
MSIFGRKLDVGQLVSEGIALLQAGKSEEAAGKLRQAVEADPKHAQAWYCLGTSDPQTLAERAIILASLKRFDEALAAIDEAIRLRVNNPQVYNNRGEILARLSRVEESVQSFDAALKLDPRFARAFWQSPSPVQRQTVRSGQGGHRFVFRNQRRLRRPWGISQGSADLM